MHIHFALFADAANVSQEGKLNILGIFDAIHMGQLPGVHPRATFVMRIKAVAEDEGTHELVLTWRNPDGATLWESRGELNVGLPPEGADGIDMPLLATLDLPVDRAGLFVMSVAINGTELSTTALQVTNAMPTVFPLAPGAPAGMVS
jgi:hypothetical protein